MATTQSAAQKRRAYELANQARPGVVTNANVNEANLRINSRRAENISEGQAAQHQQALVENQAAGQVVARQAAPVLSSVDQQALNASQTNFAGINPQGAIEKNAIERLRASGMNDAQIAQQLAAQKPNIQQAFNQVGTQSAQTVAGQNLQNNALQRGMSRADTLTPNRGAGHAVDETDAEFEQRRANVAVQETEDKKQEQMQQAEDKAKGQESAVSTAAAATAATPQQAGLQAAFANLPPEAQFLAPFLQNFMSETQGLLKENATNTTNQLAGIEKTYGGIEEKLKGMEEGYKSATEAIQGIIKEAKDETEKDLTDQLNAQNMRLSWEQNKQERDLSKQKQQVHDSMVAQIALAGGFGQDAGLQEIRESDEEFEQKLRDVQTEFGIQKTELSAKFTGMFLENKNNYRNGTIQNIKDMQSQLEKISFQSISNAQARQQAEMSVLEKGWNNQTGLRKELANKQLDVAGQMATFMLQDRNDKRTQEQAGWTQLKQAIDVYGSGVPQAMLDSISKKLPGVDLKQVITAPTLDQKKKASGGGRGIAFSASQMLPNGKPISLENFLAQKSQDYQATHGKGIQSVEIPKEQRAAWEKEYKAMELQAGALNPVQINRDLSARASYFPNVTSYNAAKDTVEDMLKNGEYEAARKFVDSTGRPLTDTATKTYKQLGNIKDAFNEMETLLDRIQNKVGPFPTEGPLWTWMNENIETDPDYQRLLVLRGTTSAQYAKGVSGESGALTDPDILRAAAGVINPNISYAAMRAGIQQGRTLTDAAIQNNIGIDRANGRTVNGIEDYLNGDTTSSTSIPLTPEQQAFLYK